MLPVASGESPRDERPSEHRAGNAQPATSNPRVPLIDCPVPRIRIDCGTTGGELPGDERLREHRAGNVQPATSNPQITLIDCPVPRIRIDCGAASGESPGDERLDEHRAGNAQPATSNPRVTLIDSPVANVANIARSLRASGATLDVTRDARTVARARKLVLPGVGSFTAAMQFLESTGLDAAVREAVANDALLLGICVGHQVLFDVSREMGTTRGLGLLRGDVQRFDGPLPVPQIGWNRVHVAPAGTALFDGVAGATPFYFVNSFAVRHAESEIASADYNGAFTAVAQQGRVLGVQFHPEKSSTAGLRVLRNFVQWS